MKEASTGKGQKQQQKESLTEARKLKPQGQQGLS